MVHLTHFNNFLCQLQSVFLLTNVSIIFFPNVEVFLYHIVPGTYYGQGLADGQWLDTLSSFGVPLQVGMVSDGASSK